MLELNSDEWDEAEDDREPFMEPSVRHREDLHWLRESFGDCEFRVEDDLDGVDEMYSVFVDLPGGGLELMGKIEQPALARLIAEYLQKVCAQGKPGPKPKRRKR